MIRKRLGDIVNFKRGYDLPSYQRKAGSYPVISSSGISGYHSEFKVEGEGLITGRYGTLGEVYYLEGKYWPHNTALYVTDFKGNYPKYVYFLLKYLGNLKTSDKSTVPGINRNDLHEVVVPYIEPEFQKPIADCLSRIEEAIEVNTRTNYALERIARTLYDFWFMQYDFPDESGKPYKSSGSRMVYDQTLMRSIPYGWNVKSLSQIESHIVTGKTPPTDERRYYDGEIPFITIDDIRTNLFVVTTEKTLTAEGANTQESKYIPEGAVCVTCIASPGLVGFASVRSQTNQQINSVVCADKCNKYYLYFAIKDYFKFSSGAKVGNTFLNMNKGDFGSINLVLPPIQIRVSFHDKVSLLFDRIHNNLRENQKLIELRDWMLPMLMNEQVTVNNKVAAT